MPPGTYEASIGGRVELTTDGRLGVAGTPFLAGAAKGLADDVAGAVRLTGLTLGDGLRLATHNPGRFVRGRGVLRRGATADLFRFRWQPGEVGLAVDAVLVRGQVVG
jgi:N-acetylglucosamine-6-phosphate deacetylase